MPERPYRGEALTEWFPRPDGTERAVVFLPGYNGRSTQYGVHGMEIIWGLRGPKGAAQFAISTGWVPGEKMSPRIADLFPMAADIGYHARAPQYDGQEEYGRDDCTWLDGRCYYDGSGMAAEAVMADFIREGEKAVWAALESWYADLRTEHEPASQ